MVDRSSRRNYAPVEQPGAPISRRAVSLQIVSSLPIFKLKPNSSKWQTARKGGTQSHGPKSFMDMAAGLPKAVGASPPAAEHQEVMLLSVRPSPFLPPTYLPSPDLASNNDPKEVRVFIFRGVLSTLNLVRFSVGVLAKERMLLVFPFATALALVALVLFAAGIFAAAGVFERISYTLSGTTVPDVIMAVFLYFTAVVVVTYFSAALVSGTLEVLEGRTLNLGAALEAANDRFLSIVLFACYARTLGPILERIRLRRTFFVLPVLMAEGRETLEAVERSTELLDEGWSRHAVATFGFGRLYAFTFLLAFVPLGFAAGSSTALAIVVAILFSLPVLLLACTALMSVEEVFRTALYQYATTGASSYFPQKLLLEAYTSRREYQSLRAAKEFPLSSWSRNSVVNRHDSSARF